MNTENNTLTTIGSMQDLMQRNVEQYPSHGIWLMQGGVRSFLSYSVIWKQGKQYANHLFNEGINSSSVIAIPMQPTAEVIIAVAALFKLGCRLIPVSYRYGVKPDSPVHKAFINTLTTCNVSAVLVEVTELDYYQEQIKELPCAVFPVTLSDEAEDAVDVLAGLSMQRSFSLVQLSSGSLSAPKGIVLSEDNILSNVAGIAERIRAVPQDICYSWLPLYHDMGLIGALFTTLYAGATIYLETPVSFIADPLSWLKKIADIHATITLAPQFAYNLCNKQKQLNPSKLDGVDLSMLRIALNGAEHIHYESCQLFESLFASNGVRPHTIQPCYGLSENCVAVTIRDLGSPLRMVHLSRQKLADGHISMMPASSDETATVLGNGTPLPGTSVMISDHNGMPVAEGQIGEVRFKGASATRSILISGTTPETLEYPPGSWVPTGDLGFMHEGDLYIVGRLKEIFKKGGRTYIPGDIEMALLEIEEIVPNHAVAISTYLYDKGQEELVIIVELFNFRIDLAQLEQNIRRVILSRFQLTPLEVLFVRTGGLAKTSSGKLKRLQIRSMYEKKELKYLL